MVLRMGDMVPSDDSFKTVSLFAAIGGADLLFNAIMLLWGTEYAADALQIAIVGVTGLVMLLLAYFGWRAHIGAVPASQVMPVAAVALMLNAADVVLAMQSGLCEASSIVVALIAACFSYVCKRTNARGGKA